ncbi:hypothetical protein [Pseudomonas sp. RIT-To-2]|uniref:hypothetical protein n=1 Tax=Pseudomonas sp. RIT-To-2 TaxID=3462541 RepID=UPI0024134599
MNKVRLLLLLALTQLGGCLSYSHHDLPQVQNWPPAAPAAEHKPRVYVSLESEHQMNGAAAAGGIAPLRWQKALVDTYTDSGLFSQVTSQKVESDVYAQAHLLNSERGSMALAWITGFTLFLVPSRVENVLTLETVYKDRDGKVLGKVTRSESLTTWMQTLLIFAVPFNPGPDAIIKQLAQSSLQEALQRKLI